MSNSLTPIFFPSAMATARTTSFLPLLLAHLLLILPAASAEQESLLPTQSLADGKTLLSPSKEFELGFFSPAGSPNRYLGIWYHKIPVQTVVWVANRIAPLHDKSGRLTIRPDGNLAVIDGEGSILWWTHLPSVTDTSFAVLMDTGNLVLYTNNGDMGRAVSWQSFDHPTDTLLPGMRIGYDGKSNRSWRLTSWRSSADPAPGVFTYGLDHGDADQFFISNRSRRHWRSGYWNGRSFNQIPGASSLFLFHFSLVKVEDEAYFEYSAMYNNTRLKMDISGNIKCMVWYDTSRAWGVAWFAPSSRCGLYGSCGVNSICSEFEQAKCKCLPEYEPAPSPEVGCRRRRELVCGAEHGYLPAGRLKVPDMETLVEAKSVGLCRTECSKDCNCTAYVFANVNGDGESQCLHWFGGLVDVASMKESYGSQEIFLKVSPSNLESNKRKVSLAMVLATTIPAFLILGAVFCLLWKKKKKKKKNKQMMKFRGTDDRIKELSMFSSGSIDNISVETELLHGSSFSENAADSIKIPTYSFVSILLATNHFSHCNFIGEGGFGRVYKGKLPGDREIAVKRLSKSSGQGIEEFKNEIQLIAKLQHRNLVRLLGCCVEKNEKLLVYEYMLNKSLDSFIFDSKQCKLLDWEKRFDIILGIARGLLYLHQDSRFRIIHRDLKTGNILLDGVMTPKISDFGMARICRGNETQGNTRNVVGTYGYMSPEYALDGLFSVKSDVFSFGVIVLEIISGKKNNRFHDPENDLSLLGYAWKLWNEEKEMELLEPLIGETAISWQVERCIQLGLLCVQENPAERPSMGAVVADLVSEKASLPLPKGPATYVRKYRLQEEERSLNDNQLTITLLEAR